MSANDPGHLGPHAQSNNRADANRQMPSRPQGGSTAASTQFASEQLRSQSPSVSAATAASVSAAPAAQAGPAPWGWPAAPAAGDQAGPADGYSRATQQSSACSDPEISTAHLEMLKAAAEGFGATDIQDLKRLVERLLIVLNRPGPTTMNSDEPELENAQSPSVPQMFGNFQNARAALGNLVAGGLQKMNLSANKDIVGVAKDLGAAITTGVSQHALHGMQKANWAGFGLGLLGCALIQAQKTASVGKSAKEMLERLATLMLDVVRLSAELTDQTGHDNILQEAKVLTTTLVTCCATLLSNMSTRFLAALNDDEAMKSLTAKLDRVYPRLIFVSCAEMLRRARTSHRDTNIGDYDLSPLEEKALEQRRNKVLAILGWNDGRRPLADVHAAIIHGMGGIGKSLLAFLVYNTVTDTQNSAQSYTRCSVQVGQHPDIDAIQNSILKQLPHPQSKVPSLRYPEALRAALKDVKNPVLLLIDDIWYSGQLSRLLPTETYLPPGSGIIITTRRLNQAQGVSSLAPRCQPYQPSLLNQEEAKQLFHRLLYQQPLPDPKCITSAQADQIATQCEGLPLLVTIMAKGLRYAPHKLKLVEGDLRGQTAFAGSREDDDDWLSLLKLSYKIMDRELCKAFLDVARLWCGLYWSEASCRFGDYLQMLVEHSLVAPVADHMGLDRVTMHASLQAMACHVIEESSCSGKAPLYVLDDTPYNQSLLGQDIHAVQLEAHPIPYPPLICGYAGLAELLTASAKSLTHVSLETTLYMSKWPHHVAAGEFTSHLGRCEVHSLPRWSEPTFLGQVQDLIEQLPKQVLRQLFTWLPRLAMKFFNWQPALYQLLDCGIHFSKPLPAMPALRRLYLSGFDMSLPYLGCSSGLQCLSIHSCDQVNLDSIQWDSLGCLAYLDLFHIPGACLPSRFSLLTGLQTFTLRACNMTAIHPDALNGLSALTSLTLHMCDNLGQLPQNLSILTNLQQLTLSMCKLWTSLPSAIGNLSLLTSLDAGFHEMTQIPNSISQLGNLKQLNLGYCKSLTSLPQDISGLTSLTRLCIQWCKSLTDIGEGISGLQKLEVLQANDCLSLSQLPTGMGSMTSLQQLKLTNNRLQALPEGFGQMLALTDLDLHDCWYLESLPPEFGQLQGLVRLDLSDCRALEALPHEFGALTNLMSLKLECCIALKRLPDCLTRLTRLQPVSLVDCCSLEPLSAAVEGMNCFTDFDKTVFADFLRGKWPHQADNHATQEIASPQRDTSSELHVQDSAARAAFAPATPEGNNQPSRSSS